MNQAAVVTTPPLGAVRLHDWGILRARGEDATTFLQGQLTHDLASAGLKQARLAGYCTAKGRLLATFIVWQAAPNEWLLACSAELLPAMLKRLSMFVLRARCHISDASAELALWGWTGDTPPGGLLPTQPWEVARPETGGQVIRLPDGLGQPRCLLALAADQAVEAPALSADTWRWLEVASGVVRVVGATSEAFVPQMVNLELVGGVSFKKGCYPGQEVVARSQYRGTLKRRGYLFSSETALQPGLEVFSSTNPSQPAGLVALAAACPERGALAFVELKRAEAQAELHAGTPDGPRLTPAPLPYALPGDED